MATRNWWIETQVDGYKHAQRGGPLAKDGGFTVTIMQRDHGERKRALRIDGLATVDGRLVLMITGPEGQEFRYETER